MSAAIAKAAVVLASAGLLGISGWHAATRWHPSGRTYPFQGVDVSAAQGEIEWPSVAADGAVFAYVTATAGLDRDARFEANWQGGGEAGLRRGALHLYSLCRGGGEQADAFNLVVPQSDDALPAAVDIAFRDDCPARPDRAVLIADLTRFVAAVETHTGRPMLLKVSRAIERRYRLSEALPRPVWAMSNGFAPGYAARPWRMWQASGFRRVQGIEGAVDWDVVAP